MKKRTLLSILVLLLTPLFLNAQEVFKLHENGVTITCNEAAPGDTATVNEILYMAVDRALLIQKRNNSDNLSKVCTSLVTDMSLVFSKRPLGFNQDIGSWDVSNVTTMASMFSETGNFNQDIGRWDVSNVIDMSSMFYKTVSFDQDISSWDVSSVTNMSFMFFQAESFNQPVGNWDVSSVIDMVAMFAYTKSFNLDIRNWDVSSVTNMLAMFFQAESFNQPIGNWDVSSVMYMNSMFFGTSVFNQPLGGWDVSSVTTMRFMFYDASLFDQFISNWDVSAVTNMESMFAYTEVFNQNIGDWDVSSVENMNQMFLNAELFNQDISSWCVENINEEPGAFASNSALIEINKPIWGTCPEPVANELNKNISEDYRLLQNYPNPFNPNTQIQFDLLEVGRVSLKVYNILGQQVAILLDEVKTVGSHSINFDASGLTSGTYIYRLSTPSGIISKQMMLIK